MIPVGEDNQGTKSRILELRVRDYEAEVGPAIDTTYG